MVEGAPADLTLLSLDATTTFKAADVCSKARNTPFDGWELHGAGAATVVGGRTVFVNPGLDGATGSSIG